MTYDLQFIFPPQMDAVSKTELKRRRQQLQRQRRLMVFKSLWRLTCLGGLCGGLWWVSSQQSWIISKPDRIKISGNQYFSSEAIRSLLAIPYPQSLLQISPDALQQKLLATGGFERVNVQRLLMPARIEVSVVDRPPVAVLARVEPKAIIGLLDDRGNAIEPSKYQSAHRSPSLTSIVPADRNSCPHWSEIYREIRRSPVLIRAVDCTRSNNFFLQTEIGKVRLGSYRTTAHLSEQIQKLDRLRNWGNHPTHQPHTYLDLENPAAPKLGSEEQK
jgi:cell division protein FtsQ